MPFIYGTRYIIINLQGIVAKKYIFKLFLCLYFTYTHDDKRYVHSRGNTQVALTLNLKEEGKVKKTYFNLKKRLFCEYQQS
jgi:hypothetical protein